MAGFQVFLVCVAIFTATSGSHMQGGTISFKATEKTPAGWVVDFKYKSSFINAYGSTFYWGCLSGDCGYEINHWIQPVDNRTVYPSPWYQNEGHVKRRVDNDKPFQLLESSCCWVANTYHESGWQLTASVDLGVRSDTKMPNRSPVTAIIPILRVPQNCATTINLLGHDPDGDLVLCRHGYYYGECALCSWNFNVDHKQCTLSTSSGMRTGSYVVELVLEDFPKSDIYLRYNDGTTIYKTRPYNRKRRELPKDSQKYYLYDTTFADPQESTESVTIIETSYHDIPKTSGGVGVTTNVYITEAVTDNAEENTRADTTGYYYSTAETIRADTTPHYIITEETTTKLLQDLETTPHDYITDEITRERHTDITTTPQYATKQTTRADTTPHYYTTEETTRADTTRHYYTTEETTRADTTPHYYTTEEITRADTTPHYYTTEETTRADTTPHYYTTEETTRADTTPHYYTTEETTRADTTPHYYTTEENTRADTTPQYYTTEESTRTDTTPHYYTTEETTKADTTPHYYTTEETTRADSTPQYYTTEETTRADTTPHYYTTEETTRADTTPQYYTTEESTRADTTPQYYTTEESTRTDTTPHYYTTEESTRTDTAPQYTTEESTRTDTAPQYYTTEETARADTTPHYYTTEESNRTDTTPYYYTTEESNRTDTTPHYYTTEETTRADTTPHYYTTEESTRTDTAPQYYTTEETARADTTPQYYTAEKSTRTDTTPHYYTPEETTRADTTSPPITETVNDFPSRTTSVFTETTQHILTEAVTFPYETTGWDFYPSSHLPIYMDSLSKISLQFLVEVTSATPSCTLGDYRPKFISPTPHQGERLLTNAGSVFQLHLSAQAAYESVSDFKVSGPPGIIKSSTSKSKSVIRSIVVEWTPSKNNVGEHVPFCFVAETSNGYQSEMRCVIVVVGPSNLDNIELICHENTMTLIAAKSSDHELYENQFRLNDPKCLVSSNGTHIIASVAYNSCGTETEETVHDIVFKNQATSFSNKSSVITRKHGVSIPFNCSFPKKNRVSASFCAHKSDYVFAEAGFGNFTYKFQFYTDNRFVEVETQYPMEVVLQELLYMEIQVSSSVPNVQLFVESCKASPHDDPDDPTFYDIIQNGCIKDETLVVYGTTRTEYRFAMEAFAFIGDYNDVYISCTVILCKFGDPGTRCSQGCIRKSLGDSNRHRRSLTLESQQHFISQGPIRMKRQAPSNADRGASPSLNVNTLVISVSGVVIVGLLAFIAHIYTKRVKRFRKQLLKTEDF